MGIVKTGRRSYRQWSELTREEEGLGRSSVMVEEEERGRREQGRGGGWNDKTVPIF